MFGMKRKSKNEDRGFNPVKIYILFNISLVIRWITTEFALSATMQKLRYYADAAIRLYFSATVVSVRTAKNLLMFYIRKTR